MKVWSQSLFNYLFIIFYYYYFFKATIKSTVDACDVTDHELAKLVAGLLEVRKYIDATSSGFYFITRGLLVN